MALEHVPRCQHVKVNGVQCGSPALRDKAHCYFHTRAEHERNLAIAVEGKRTFGFPLLEDANSIQIALMKVIQMLGAGSLERDTAPLMIYALQTASYNLRQTKFEVERLTDVVIDEDTVDLTRIQGAQWAARDFPPPPPPQAQSLADEETVEDTTRESAGNERLPNDNLVQDDLPEEEVQKPPAAANRAAAEARVSSVAISNSVGASAARKAPPVDPDAVGYARRREQKRKLRRYERELEEEPDSLAAVLFKRMGLPPLSELENETESEDGRRA